MGTMDDVQRDLVLTEQKNLDALAREVLSR